MLTTAQATARLAALRHRDGYVTNGRRITYGEYSGGWFVRPAAGPRTYDIAIFRTFAEAWASATT